MSDFAEQRQIRLDKLSKLRSDDKAFINGFKPENNAAALHELYQDKNEFSEQQVSLAGRVMTKRLMGKACFVTLKDASAQIQVYFRKNDLNNYDLIESLDLGDIIFLTGKMFRTQKGELSVWAASVELLTKSLRPLPDKYHGLHDVETRYRQRYLDLIANDPVLAVMRTRSQIVQAIRNFFNGKGFLEVETPMMQVQPGGANAKPFATHLNALSLPLFLRIAPELYLKRLIVGGFDKVFELNRNFRNEGMSTKHNPEFTMIEFYQAYATFVDMMDLTEELFAYLRQQLSLPEVITYQEHSVNLTKFARVSLEQLLCERHGLDKNSVRNLKALELAAEKAGVKFDSSQSIGAMQLYLFEETIEADLIQPTFVTDYPMDVSPLARRNSQDDFLSDRFELFIVGRELANGFSELNDPEDQAARFAEQVALKVGGDDEAMSYDEDYICALEHGMPPTAGQGIGIDRLVMLLTNQASIRDVILFPTMKPKALTEAHQ